MSAFNPGKLNRASLAEKQVAVANLGQAIVMNNKDPRKGPMIAKGFESLLNPQHLPLRSCMGGRETLLRRPLLPVRLSNPDIEIAGGEQIFSTIVADDDWSSANNDGLNKDKNRVLLSRNFDPNELYSLAQNRYIRWIRPHLSIFASTPGVALDHELSKQFARIVSSNLALIVDEDGKGKNLALAPSLFEHSSKKGIILAGDQVFKFGDNTEISFDFKGEGELSDYVAADKKLGGAASLSIEIGCDIILTDSANENIDDLIQQAMEAAA